MIKPIPLLLSLVSLLFPSPPFLRFVFKSHSRRIISCTCSLSASLPILLNSSLSTQLYSIISYSLYHSLLFLNPYFHLFCSLCSSFPLPSLSSLFPTIFLFSFSALHVIFFYLTVFFCSILFLFLLSLLYFCFFSCIYFEFYLLFCIFSILKTFVRLLSFLSPPLPL